MSQKDGSESDIWEYRPLEKKKKTQKSSTATTRKCTTKRTTKKPPAVPVKSPEPTVNAAGSGLCSDGPPQTAPCDGTVQTDSAADEGPSSGDFCPMCQMPFSFLVVQSKRWHVAECLDTPRDTCKECPDGLHCSSIIPNHYKKFNHTLLAHSRANSDEALLSLSQQAETSGETSLTCFTGLVNNEAGGFILESSQDSALSISSSSDHGVSLHSNQNETPQANRRNGLLLLRSPGPEDFKKKKGWSSSGKNQKPVSASQESRTELSSTPLKAESERQACEPLPEKKPSPDYNDAISYSPLSEFPSENEVKMTECRKSLFNNEASENETGDSPVLFDDSFSSEDELLSQFIETLETNNAQLNEPSSSNTQLESITSSPPTNQTAAFNKSSFQSPQSIVLERLRETILSSDHLPLKNLNDSSQSEQPQTSSLVPSLQNPIVQSSQTMPPQRGQSKVVQASGLKQTDIGVFFGLKPLKEKVKEAPSGSNNFNAASTPTLGEKSGQKRPRRERQRKRNGTAEASQGTDTVENGNVGNAQGEAGRGRARGRRGRWNRGGGDGEERVQRCPFYKKIPGTKFVVDAFRYGEIEGITAYFLTHFHSDHYGGLTKKSTFPIYCNRITGNLVKSKLKVAEQYVHILPMNTRVTVEGVTVIFLEANHCPGAAMLLFFLPDGQIVLHTGDFRADPSMETYPELLNCRVQTLYLDTTYCSPEYTFPKQQEVINFAANTAFELVTLHPRTLVVCGSYSVGKEKVFLALAEILGSKVCLSRDKYNTMCCLESEQVRQSITTDGKAAQVHVLPMMQLSFKKLQDYLARFSRQYDRLVAFKPTGWTFSQQVESVEDIQPQISGNISIYGIPYSEHSSFLELKRFVQWLKPFKIIPTVNNGSSDSRTAMKKCFSEWLSESEANS